METIDFFQGTRVKPPLILSFYDGKAELKCTISEGWGPLIVRTVKCGGKYVRTLKRSVGMVYTERDDLESLVSSSLGLKGIASLDAQISSKVGVELQLNRCEEVEDEFTFEAPKCGERLIALYQLKRNLDLRFRDDRLFHKKEWTMSTTYWVDRIHDNSYLIPEIPDCGCKDNQTEPGDGRVYVDMWNITMTTEFIEDKDKVRIPSLDVEVDKAALHLPLQLQKSKLPEHLLFLAGNIPDTINAKFSLNKALSIENLPVSEIKIEDIAHTDTSLHMTIIENLIELLKRPVEVSDSQEPVVSKVKIPVEKIGALIGPGGKNIRDLQDETGTKIDVDVDGTVFIVSKDAISAKKAKEQIEILGEGAAIGNIYTGKVVRIADFGAFVEILPGVDGLVHISQLDTERVNKVEDAVTMGDEVTVMVTDIDPQGKIRLSRQAVLEGWDLEEARKRDRRTLNQNRHRG